MPLARLLASHVTTLALLAAAGCAPFGTDQTRYPSDALPRVGLAVKESSGRWCAQFATDARAVPLKPQARGALIFAESGTSSSLPIAIVGPRQGPCETAFVQPRWISYEGFSLDPTGKEPPPGDPIIALVVMSEIPWRTSTRGVVAADLDGDGAVEEIHRCLAGEGEHWTIWTVRNDSARVRRWHEYFDWGAFVDADCGPGEDGPGE